MVVNDLKHVAQLQIMSEYKTRKYIYKRQFLFCMFFSLFLKLSSSRTVWVPSFVRCTQLLPSNFMHTQTAIIINCVPSITIV